MSYHVFDLTKQKWTQVFIPFEYKVFSQKTGGVIEKGKRILNEKFNQGELDIMKAYITLSNQTWDQVMLQLVKEEIRLFVEDTHTKCNDCQFEIRLTGKISWEPYFEKDAKHIEYPRLLSEA